MEQIYTVDDLAEMFKVSASTIRDLCSRREWPHMRVGRAVRFTEAMVQEIVEIQSVRVSIETRRVNDLMARTGLTRRGAERHVRSNPWR